jgi:hypothetical protein
MSFNLLPPLVLCHIANMLDYKTFGAFQATCRRVKRVCDKARIPQRQRFHVAYENLGASARNLFVTRLHCCALTAHRFYPQHDPPEEFDLYIKYVSSQSDVWSALEGCVWEHEVMLLRGLPVDIPPDAFLHEALIRSGNAPIFHIPA